MPLIAAGIMGGMGLLGSSISGNAAQNAANTQAQAQLESARIAAEAAKFKPIGTTTRFGSSQFGYTLPGEAAPTQADYKTPEEFAAASADYQQRAMKGGDLTSQGYTMSPELLAQQNQLMSGAGAALPQAGTNAQVGQGLFNLGQQYSAINPQEAAAQWMKQQQAILQPGQDQTYAALQQQLQNTGRGGFSVAQGGNLQSANPELAAYYNSLANQQNQLAGQATQMGQAQATFGAGLMGTGLDLQSAAYNPYKTQFGLAQTLESAAQQPLTLSAELGGRSATAGATAANALFQGGNLAAASQAKADAYSPWGTGLTSLGDNQALGTAISDWWKGTPTPTNMTGFQSPYTPITYPASTDAPMGSGMWLNNKQGI